MDIRQPSEDDVSLLVIIVDANPMSWGQRMVNAQQQQALSLPQIGLTQFLDNLSFFINAYLLLNHQNMLAVIASRVGESQFIYPPNPSMTEAPMEDITDIRRFITERIKSLAYVDIPTSTEDTGEQASSFSGAMSQALCYIHRELKSKEKGAQAVHARLLVFASPGYGSLNPDVSSQYIPVMNCIFSAQKLGVPVDACVLAGGDSTFLSQAAHLTNGVYLRPLRQDGLSHYLVSTFLADAYSRRFITLPKLKTVDFRASCFCHKKIIDMGYVCSVCLSIFCKYSLACSTCGTKFALPKMPSDFLMAKKMKPAAPPQKPSPATQNGQAK
jgi:transcription initiation factor TFIIH subunit 3